MSHHFEAVAAIIVVAIDNGKRFVDYVLTHHQCMVGAPGFCTFRRASKSFGECIQRLEHHFGGNMIFVFREHFGTEIFFKVFSNNEHHLSESTFNGIVDRVVHDGFTVWSQPVELFQSAITAPHTGGKNE